ncbi:glycosyltransferase [Pseudomonas corrugata]|nr:glycosyltransferase [Pseudomonas corrugata]MDU9037530.1 glycosyltransferase [Pseudomonas corrugata]
MDKGTIIYLGGFELPDKNAAAHRVVANAKIFCELGYKVCFIGISNVVSDKKIKKEVFFGFDSWSIPYPQNRIDWLKYISGPSALFELLKEQLRLNKVVGVVCYNYPAMAQLRIKRLCKSSNIRVISDATEWYDTSSGNILHRLVKFIDTSLRMLWVNQRVDGIITTSKYLTSFYRRRGKLVVELPTLFDAARFKSPLVRDSNLIKFIYVGSPFDSGRVNKHRSNLKERLDVCVEIFYQLYKIGENFKFSIYGVTEEEYLKVFSEHACILQEMQGCVSFNGRQPHQLVLEKIASSDFSIFFRDKTRVTMAGFPSKLAESVSCGTPVISNVMVSLENYEEAEGLFLAKRGEELELVKKLLRLTSAEINVIKQSTYLSGTFDYKNYTLQVASFFDEIGV